MLPTIITGLADDSTCMQEEIFGECGVALCVVIWYAVVWIYVVVWSALVQYVMV